MIDVIARFAKTDGDHMTQIAGLSLHRHGGDAPVNCSAYRPSLAIIVQGAKRVVLGEETLIYGASDYLLTSIDLPVLSQVCQASADEPYLSMAFTLDPGKIQALLASLSQLPAPAASVRGMSVSKITVELEDAALRLLRLLERPDDIPALLPLIEQEILYRLLTGPHGHRLRQMATTDSQPHQVGRAVAWLKEHYSRPLRIDDLANRVSMSVSSLHHHFKAITAMSPPAIPETASVAGGPAADAGGEVSTPAMPAIRWVMKASRSSVANMPAISASHRCATSAACAARCSNGLLRRRRC